MGNRQVKAVLGEGRVREERKKEDYGDRMNKCTDTLAKHGSGRVEQHPRQVKAID